MTGAPIYLATIRKERGLTLRDLASMIGKDPATVQRAEVGHSSAKLETYIDCAEALGLTLADIFVEPDRLAAERALVKAYRSLPKDRQRGWDDLVASVLAQRLESDPEEGEIRDPKGPQPTLQNPA